jgi:hypothetical protein
LRELSGVSEGLGVLPCRASGFDPAISGTEAKPPARRLRCQDLFRDCPAVGKPVSKTRTCGARAQVTRGSRRPTGSSDGDQGQRLSRCTKIPELFLFVFSPFTGLAAFHCTEIPETSLETRTKFDVKFVRTHPRWDRLSSSPSHFVLSQPHRLTTNSFQSPYSYRASGLAQIAVSALPRISSADARKFSQRSTADTAVEIQRQMTEVRPTLDSTSREVQIYHLVSSKCSHVRVKLSCAKTNTCRILRLQARC